MDLIIGVEGALVVGDVPRARAYVRALNDRRGARRPLVAYCRDRGILVNEYLADVSARVCEAGKERCVIQKGGVSRC